MIKLPRRVKPCHLELLMEWLQLWHTVRDLERGDGIFHGFEGDEKVKALEIFKRLNPDKTEPYDPEEVQGFCDE